jgi:PAS domain S-box-containing protein
MKDEGETKEQLINELAELRQRVAELEAADTERVRAEERLAYQAYLLANVNDAILATDDRFVVTAWNRAAEEIHGWKAEEAIGRVVQEVIPSDFTDAQRAEALRSLAEEGRYRVEVSMYRRDGQQIYVEGTTVALRGEDGRITGYVSVNRDITERKWAEEEIGRLAKFPGENPNPVLRVAKDGTILYVNKASQPLLNVWGCQEGQPLPDYWRKFTSDVLSSGTSEDTEVEVEDRILSLTFAPVVEADYVNVYGLDVTERERAEEERERLLAELEAKNRELQSFVYTVSHDLRAPLISLDGFSSVLQKEFHDQLGGEGKHYLERIQANVAHMDALIMDLLELSRIGRVVGAIEEIDVAALLREIQEELAVELEEARAEFMVQEPLPAVRGDRGRIRQVFVNLIDNTVKFKSEERPLRIEVGCQEERDFYRFYIADSGIGIARQYQEQIFAPFQQLDAETEGVGMGLALLVKKIVEHHGGRVWVESESGKGATFYFTVPVIGKQ